PTPPPSSSTLFPYTTLFRSLHGEGNTEEGGEFLRRARLQRRVEDRLQAARLRHQGFVRDPVDPRLRVPGTGASLQHARRQRGNGQRAGGIQGVEIGDGGKVGEGHGVVSGEEGCES